VKVNTPIARLKDEAGAAAPAATAAATPSEVPGAAAAPAATPKAAPAPAKADGARVFASPLARRLAAQGNIDLSAVKGSGPHGRIVKRDLEGALAGSAKSATASASSAPAG